MMSIGQREHDGRIFFDADFGQRLQVAELNRGGLRFEHLRGLGQLRRRLRFALRVNHLGAALAFRLRLPADGALHLLRDIDLLDFHLRYLNTPGLGILVKDHLQLAVYLFALGEDLVELKLPDDAAQRGLRLLRSGVEIILHLRKREIRVHHAEISRPRSPSPKRCRA